MKIKTSELIGDALDWAVCSIDTHPSCGFYTTYWDDGGPIIEREKISLEYLPGAGDGGVDVWVATRVEGPCISEEQADKPLIAAMRCFVASKLGDEVEVPEELQ